PMVKKQLGQFFTKNADYILNNLAKYVRGKNVADPFAGNGDLMKWASRHYAKRVRGFDVDRTLARGKIGWNDSINNPRHYDFVVTNPPYLNINKADQKTKGIYFRNFDYEDLYQASLGAIMESEGGIVIVPVNFLSAENAGKIRDRFFAKFRIDEINYFREQVFADTTYNVIAFHYRRREKTGALLDGRFIMKTHIYPDDIVIPIELRQKYHWTIGGEVTEGIKKYDNVLGVRRLIENEITESKGPVPLAAAYNHVDTKIAVNVSEDLYRRIKSNIILLKAIDSGTPDGRIALEDIRNYGVECLVSKESSRHMIYFLFDHHQPTIREQEEIINLFNQEMSRMRENHLSLFLTNYRDNDRKRVSFDFVYKFINYLYATRIRPRRENNIFASPTRYEPVG
ncbi:MAG: hypothetical protein AAB967_02730, partial [Patescibacteria group bacterium]